VTLSSLPSSIRSAKYSALQIFQDLSHPSALSNSAVARRSHEGLSLFSLLSHTCTPQGNALLRQWFLTPLQSVREIGERQDAIAFFLSSETQDAVKEIRVSLKKVGDIHTTLNSIRRGGTFSNSFSESRRETHGGEETNRRQRMESFIRSASPRSQ